MAEHGHGQCNSFANEHPIGISMPKNQLVFNTKNHFSAIIQSQLTYQIKNLLCQPLKSRHP